MLLILDVLSILEVAWMCFQVCKRRSEGYSVREIEIFVFRPKSHQIKPSTIANENQCLSKHYSAEYNIKSDSDLIY